jgi:hypothetical protein
MWILVAEAMGALTLFLFIVWWTLGPTQRREREAMRELASAEADAKPSDVDTGSTAAESSRSDR